MTRLEAIKIVARYGNRSAHLLASYIIDDWDEMDEESRECWMTLILASLTYIRHPDRDEVYSVYWIM